MNKSIKEQLQAIHTVILGIKFTWVTTNTQKHQTGFATDTKKPNFKLSAGLYEFNKTGIISALR